MTIHPEFKLGQKVYIVTDPEQFVRIITKYIITENSIEYEVAMGMMTVICQHFEISEDKNILNY